MTDFEKEILQSLGDIRGDVRVLLTRNDAADARLDAMNDRIVSQDRRIDEVEKKNAYRDGRAGLVATIVSALITALGAAFMYFMEKST